MKRLDIPANLWLFKITPERIAHLKPVKVLDILEGNTQNFHEDGLFSTSIFGRVGSDERDQRFSYIDLKVPVLHPLIYKHLVKLKGLYGGIMAGRAYAIWNDEEKDFEAADQINGKTGYAFFMKYWKKIVHKQSGSDIRDMRIQLVEKFKADAETTKVLVLPAGLRDIQIDESGQTKEGEINSPYRSLIAISNSIASIQYDDLTVLDTSRSSLQNAFNLVYATIEAMIEGKKGFILSKWGYRNIFNGTRNVISSMDTSVPLLGAPNSPKYNATVSGLYQTVKGVLPKTKFYLLNGYLKYVFGNADSGANLVNPKTLKRENVKLHPDYIDRWYTSSGLEKVITSMQDPEIRLKPIEIEGYYLGLIYRGPDQTFRIFGDIDELPQDGSIQKEYVHPISLMELIYLSGYREWNKHGVFVTRYPITGEGSIYPSNVYVKTTIQGEVRYELGPDWQRLGEEFKALEYPCFDNPVFVDTLIPHPSRITGMGADFDGDTASANFMYTDESNNEIDRYFNQRSSYIAPNGLFHATPFVHTVNRVVIAMTGP